jgi:flagellar biosynthetic protein FliQ
MDQQEFITILQKTLMLVMILSAPVLVVSLVVGLIISIFQAVTQIQESTLTFVPKILAGILVIIFLAPWMLQLYITNVTDMFNNMSQYIH